MNQAYEDKVLSGWTGDEESIQIEQNEEMRNLERRDIHE